MNLNRILSEKQEHRKDNGMNRLYIKRNSRWYVFTLLLLSFLFAGCSSDSMDLEERAEQEDRKKGFLHIGDNGP